MSEEILHKYVGYRVQEFPLNPEIATYLNREGILQKWIGDKWINIIASNYLFYDLDNGRTYFIEDGQVRRRPHPPAPPSNTITRDFIITTERFTRVPIFGVNPIIAPNSEIQYPQVVISGNTAVVDVSSILNGQSRTLIYISDAGKTIVRYIFTRRGIPQPPGPTLY